MLHLLVFQQAARIVGAGRIDRFIALLDVRDDSFPVDHKRRALGGGKVISDQDAVLSDHFAIEVTEQRKRYADLLRESIVGRRTVNTDS